MRRNFTDIEKAYDFAYRNNVPLNREPELKQMEFRALAGLRIRREWILGMKTEFRHQPDSPWLKADREYVSLAHFMADYHELDCKVNVKVTGYYCYQLCQDQESLIHLIDLSEMSLSTQLTKYTGDGYNVHSFHNEDDLHGLTASGVIIHRETKQRFFVPAADAKLFS